MPGDHRGREPADVIDEEIRIERHLEDAAREREPRLLISPEAAHAAAHPDVKAALLGNRGGELADHHGGTGTLQSSGVMMRITSVAA